MTSNQLNKSSGDTTLNLKGGVLIIGSLLWQDHYNKDKEDNIRKLWRDRYLLLDHRIMVSIPIRYGRLSKSNVYTMVFSNSCSKNKKGTGYFIPFKQTPIANYDDLVNEAKELSFAEGMKGRFSSTENGNEEVWCVLGILTNPKTINITQEKDLLDKWSNLLNNHGNFDHNEFRLCREKACINERGKLNISWPTPIDIRDYKRINSFDFIIATVPKPTKYPDLIKLAENVKTDTTRHYFIENYKSGITTFQDINVLNRLSNK